VSIWKKKRLTLSTTSSLWWTEQPSTTGCAGFIGWAVTKVMSQAMGAFDTIAMLDGMFGSGHIAALNAKLHESTAYNVFQFGVSAVAAFTGGMASTMQCFVAGTLILTMNGLRTIEELKAGKIYDPEGIHHIPAGSASDLSYDDGPAIRMEKGDHRQTASCGGSKEAIAYRAKQAELIKQGKFRDAIKMDIKDIRSQFGNKYDDAIGELWKYVNKLEGMGKI